MSSIWMGEDHLVHVKGRGFLVPFTEQYRRFRYEDIQYFAVSPKGRALTTTLLSLGVLACVSFFSLFLLVRDPGPPGPLSLTGLAVSAAGAILALFFLFRHLVLGPTCVCDLQTSLQRERLGSLNRMHLANQALELLGDAIAPRQARLVSSTLPEESIRAPSRTGEERFRVAGTVSPAFLVYLVFAALALGALHLESVALCAAALGFAIAGNLLVVTSLVRSFRQPSPPSIRSLLLSLFGAILFFGGVALVYFIHMAAADPIFTVGLSGPFEAFAGIPTLGGTAYYLVFLASILLILLVAGAGTLETSRWRRSLAEIAAADSDWANRRENGHE